MPDKIRVKRNFFIMIWNSGNLFFSNIDTNIENLFIFDG